MKAVVGSIAALFVGILALSWIVTGNQFFLYKVFAPATEAVRRETFEQSKARRQGLEQELQNMQFQYEQASPEHRVALRSIILRRTADVDWELPSHLSTFINQLSVPGA